MSAAKSEYRIKKNRIKRQRQLCRRIGIVLLTTVLVFGSSLLFFSFRTKAQSNDEEIFYKYYKSITVQTGDTLWDFAQQYCDDHYNDYQEYVAEVMNMNTLSESESITAGQNIIIPYYSSEFAG